MSQLESENQRIRAQQPRPLCCGNHQERMARNFYGAEGGILQSVEWIAVR
jgi:hypothetical protein